MLRYAPVSARWNDQAADPISMRSRHTQVRSTNLILADMGQVYKYGPGTICQAQPGPCPRSTPMAIPAGQRNKQKSGPTRTFAQNVKLPKTQPDQLGPPNGMWSVSHLAKTRDPPCPPTIICAHESPGMTGRDGAGRLLFSLPCDPNPSPAPCFKSLHRSRGVLRAPGEACTSPCGLWAPTRATRDRTQISTGELADRFTKHRAGEPTRSVRRRGRLLAVRT
jgi:hypothetical protein